MVDTGWTQTLTGNERIGPGYTRPFAFSADGRWVATSSGVYDRQNKQFTRSLPTTDSFSMSADGRFVSFVSFASDLVPYDINNAPDIFVTDVRSGDTERVSFDTNGSQTGWWSSSPSIVARMDGSSRMLVASWYGAGQGEVGRVCL